MPITNYDDTLLATLVTAEYLIETQKVEIKHVTELVRCFFQDKRLADIEGTNFYSHEFSLRWHKVLVKTGLADSRPQSKIGVFFDRLLDSYPPEWIKRATLPDVQSPPTIH